MTHNGLRLGALVMAGVLLGLGAREDDALPDDLARVPAKSQVVTVARVADLWSGEVGKDLRKSLGKEVGPIVDGFKRDFGVAPEDAERVTTAAPDPNRAEDQLLIVRSKKPLDAKTVFPDAEADTITGQTVYVTYQRAWFVSADSKTLVAGKRAGIEKYLKDKPAGPTGPLAKMLAGADKHSISVYFDPSSLAKMIDKLPAPLTPAKPLILASNGVAQLDLGYTSKLGMKITFKDEKEAGRGRKSIDAIRALGSLALSGLGESVAAKSKPLAALMAKAEKALDDGTVEQKGSAVEAAFALTLDKEPTVALVKEAAGKLAISSTIARAANNLKQIGLALHNYHDVHNAFPPQAIYDKDGKALLSWRVAVLPYLDQNELYKQFRLDEPWDSEHNKKLLAKIPPAYVSPQGKASAVGGTFYQVLLGKMAFFEGKRGIKIGDVVDGLSNTLMVVEAPTDVPWTKPDDIPFDPDGKLPKVGGLFEPGFNALFGDGSVRFLSKDLKPEKLKALITRNGGEPVTAD
jgi:hypothetical protein